MRCAKKPELRSVHDPVSKVPRKADVVQDVNDLVVHLTALSHSEDVKLLECETVNGPVLTSMIYLHFI